MINDPLSDKQFKSIKEIIKYHNASEFIVYTSRRKGKTLKEALELGIKNKKPAKKLIIDPNTGKGYKTYKDLLSVYGINPKAAIREKTIKNITYEEMVKGLNPVIDIFAKDETLLLTNPIEPNHYKTGNMECIDALAETLGSEGIKSFCKGNVIKYLWRYEKKNGVEDLKKAQWYLNKLIDLHN